MEQYFVYILRSEKSPIKYYVGFSENIQSRILEHNAGKCPYTSKYRPWRIKTVISFDNKEKALAFETYLKSPSGRAFSKKHL